MPSCATNGCAHAISTLPNPDEDRAWLCDQHQRKLDVACGQMIFFWQAERIPTAGTPVEGLFESKFFFG
jgi:hypothetical protein